MSGSTKLNDLLPPENRIEALAATTADAVVIELLEKINEVEPFEDGAIKKMAKEILAREKEGTTAIGHGIAIPHMKQCPYVTEIRAAIGRTQAGIDFASIDGELAHLFFLILIPEGMESGHVQVMKKVVQLSRDGKTINYLVHAEKFGNIEGIFEEIDDNA